MSRIARLSDRHSRKVDGLGSLPPTGITVRVQAPNLASISSQHTLACLGNLLCRLTGSVKSVFLAIEEREFEVALPHRASGYGTVEALLSMPAWANGGAIPFSLDDDTPADFTVTIGEATQVVGKGVNIMGAGWLAWAGTEPSPEQLLLVDDTNPIGPYFAACLGAAEIFKFSRGLCRGRFAANEAYSLWDGKCGTLAELTQGPALDGPTIPPFLLVGAGAVGQGLVLVLGASRPAQCFVATIDFDPHDDTNLNRCFIAGEADEGHPKVDAVARFRKLSSLDGSEMPCTLAEFAASPPILDLPADFGTAIANDHYPLVVSAVDRNDSRWDIQGLSPDLVLGGSTNNLTANSATYAQASGRCLACYNPRESDNARYQALLEELRPLNDEAKRAFLIGKVPDDEIEHVIDHLSSNPRCGSLGEKALKDFARSSETEFSVSFVSMAAAVMLFSRLIRSTADVNVSPYRAQFSNFNFRNLRGGDYELCREPSCPHCEERQD